ncbi:calcyclin-binding protein [Palaemon carinicauda]|uniref:calcyclin-binding protein n=1 Tax=Palaemon carinicauda TaxID=392227 RepID=UPI0035B5CFA5
MSNKLEELLKDVAELRTLVASATRKRIQDILAEELRKMELEVTKLQEEMLLRTEPAKPKDTTNKIYTVKIRNYSWDQSDKFVKLYISLKNVQSLEKENIISSFEDKSFSLMVQELDGKNHHLTISNLAFLVKKDACYHKVKTDMVVVFLAKDEAKKWEAVTAEEVQLIESRKPKSEDPSNGMMDLMKQMYLDGDDKMKQMMNKTWYESQQKSLKAEAGGMPGLDDI